LALAVITTVLAVAPARADEIPLEKQGETYTVPVTINGTIKIKFTLDSGASDVLIPADTALTLVRSGTLVETDFIGSQTYSLADGSTLQSAKFMLRQMQVGNQILRDVVASVGPVTSTPLLGQSFLSRIGSWTLDNNRHMLVERNGYAIGSGGVA
jgi:clan AA aspartic protease (TIGR02281 family)